MSTSHCWCPLCPWVYWSFEDAWIPPDERTYREYHGRLRPNWRWTGDVPGSIISNQHCRGQPTAYGPPTYSSEGTAKRILADYKSMYNKLYKQFQKITIKCQQYREETHGLRDAAETTRKQMEYLTRKIDHLTSERDNFKNEKERNELILKNWIKASWWKQRAVSCREVQRIETKKQSVERQGEASAQYYIKPGGQLAEGFEEIEVLARALEVRTEELDLNPNNSVEDTLLYKVAKLKQVLQQRG